jgi:hypothetical protein
LHAGDVIEKIYWHEIPSGQRASAAMQQILEREARVGAPLTFHLRRDGERLAIDMAPSAHCDFDLILTGKIYVTDGLVRFFDDDSELAAVLGHVLGHALHGHAGDQSVPEEVVERLGALQMATMEPQDRNRLSRRTATVCWRPASRPRRGRSLRPRKSKPMTWRAGCCRAPAFDPRPWTMPGAGSTK